MNSCAEIAHNARYAAAPITTPTLAVGAANVFGAAVGDNLRHAASNVQTVVIDGCGHYVSEERPHELASLLRTFFTEHA